MHCISSDLGKKFGHRGFELSELRQILNRELWWWNDKRYPKCKQYYKAFESPSPTRNSIEGAPREWVSRWAKILFKMSIISGDLLSSVYSSVSIPCKWENDHHRHRETSHTVSPTTSEICIQC